MKNIIAFICGFGGLLMMMGAANDCDGACMDQANSLEMTIILSIVGLGLFVFGLWFGGAFNERD